MKNSYKPYGITTISCLPVRQEPDHKSEMCSQLLFGESYQCLSMKDHWIEIKCLLDQTIGWISLDSYVGQDEPGPSLTKNPVYIAAQMVTLVQEDCCNYPFTILPGSTLPCRPELGVSFQLAGHQFKFVSPIPEAPLLDQESNVQALALIYIHAPYLWGGRSPFGIDSAGLIQMVGKIQHKVLPRTLDEQVKLGTSLPFVQDAQAGDLAFFDNAEGEIIHAGMITTPGYIIHSSGYVREDKIDHAGIFDHQQNEYIYNLRVVNRLD